jgi:hypothetical protein
MHAHAVARQPGERPGGGVAVGVVRADRDQRDPGSAGGQEAGIGVAAAVVRHLQHVRAQVDPARHQPGLRAGPQVAGEQHPDPADGRPHHHGEVVGRRRGGRPRRVRRQHLDGDTPDRAAVARHEHGLLSAGPVHEPCQGTDPIVGGRQRAGRDHADVAAGESTRQTTDVIGVQVRQQHQRQGVDAHPVQAPVDRPDVGPAVHEHAGPGTGRQHERVALPDVAGHGDRLRRRPAPHRLAQRPAHHDEPDDGGQREGPEPGKPPEGPDANEEHHGQQDRAAAAGRPAGRRVRHGRGAFGDDHQPTHRPAREPDERVGQRRDDRPHDRGDQAEDRGRGDRRRREQVGRQGDQADRAGQAGHDRRGRQAGGGAHRQRVGDGRRPPARPQPARPARREQDDGGGGHDRQGEPRVPGEPGIVQQQHADGGAQCGYRGARPPRGQREQRHRPHRGGADHAGAGAGQDDEPDQHEPRDDGLHPPVHDPAAQRPEHTGQHDRDVRPGNSREMREPGPPELLRQHRVHGPGVADDEARQQARRPWVEHPAGRGGEPVPEGTGRSLQPARSADRRGRPAGGDHRDDAVPRFRQRDTDPDPYLLTGQQVLPFRPRREQQDPGVQPVGPPPVGQCRDGRIGDDPRYSGTGQPVRVPVQCEADHHRAARIGERPQRRGLPRGLADRRHGRGDRERGENADRHGRRGPRPLPVGRGQGERQDDRSAGTRRQPCYVEKGRQQTAEPHADRGGDEAQVDPGPPGSRRFDGPAHTVTSSASSAAIAGPMPGTSSSSSTLVNGPRFR